MMKKCIPCDKELSASNYSRHLKTETCKANTKNYELQVIISNQEDDIERLKVENERLKVENERLKRSQVINHITNIEKQTNTQINNEMKVVISPREYFESKKGVNIFFLGDEEKQKKKIETMVYNSRNDINYLTSGKILHLMCTNNADELKNNILVINAREFNIMLKVNFDYCKSQILSLSNQEDYNLINNIYIRIMEQLLQHYPQQFNKKEKMRVKLATFKRALMKRYNKLDEDEKKAIAYTEVKKQYSLK